MEIPFESMTSTAYKAKDGRLSDSIVSLVRSEVQLINRNRDAKEGCDAQQRMKTIGRQTKPP
jgi:hypothetical protein